MLSSFKYGVIYDFSTATSYLIIKLAGALLAIPLLLLKWCMVVFLLFSYISISMETKMKLETIIVKSLYNHWLTVSYP